MEFCCTCIELRNFPLQGSSIFVSSDCINLGVSNLDPSNIGPSNFFIPLVLTIFFFVFLLDLFLNYLIQYRVIFLGQNIMRMHQNTYTELKSKQQSMYSLEGTVPSSTSHYYSNSLDPNIFI